MSMDVNEARAEAQRLRLNPSEADVAEMRGFVDALAAPRTDGLAELFERMERDAELASLSPSDQAHRLAADLVASALRDVLAMRQDSGTSTSTSTSTSTAKESDQ